MVVDTIPVFPGYRHFFPESESTGVKSDEGNAILELWGNQIMLHYLQLFLDFEVSNFKLAKSRFIATRLSYGNSNAARNFVPC